MHACRLHTAIELRQMEQSWVDEEFAELAAVIFRRRLCVAMLYHVSARNRLHMAENILESVELVLPATVELQPHFHAAKYHFLTALEVDTQLHDVAIVNGERLRFRAGRAEADVVEESARGTFDVFDVPFPILGPKFAVSSTDNLALKAHGGGRRGVGRHGRLVVSLRIAANPNDLVAARQSSRYGRERQARARCAGVVVGREADRGKAVGHRGRCLGHGVARRGSACSRHVGRFGINVRLRWLPNLRRGLNTAATATATAAARDGVVEEGRERINLRSLHGWRGGCGRRSVCGRD